jgi:RHS repeat-associated protein
VVDTVYGPCACSALGKVVQVSQPHAPNASPVWTTYTYDVRGRTLTATKPDGSVTHYAYAGNKTTVTDAAGNWKTFTSDALGNLVQVTEPNPSGGSTDTYYTYTALNQLATVQMPRNGYTQTRTFNWSGTDLMSTVNPENGTVQYQYNADGTLYRRTDAKGQMVQYTYDTYKRLVKVNRSDGTEDDYYYDSNPWISSMNSGTNGRLAAVTFRGLPDANNPSNTKQFSYVYSYAGGGLVSAKRLRVTRNVANPPSTSTVELEADYNYDNEGHMLWRSGPVSSSNGGLGDNYWYYSYYFPYMVNWPTVYTFGYDTMGRPNTLVQNNYGSPTTLVSGVSYGPAGEVLQINGANGYSGESRTYNSLLQVTQINAPGVSIQYTYPGGPNIGKISKQKDLVSGEEVQYSYDALGRLISAQTTSGSQGPPWGYSYGYDGFGNLLTKAVTQGTPSAGLQVSVDPSTNRIVGDWYDANGNLLLANGQVSASYDVENRVSGVNGESYAYDPGNKRVDKQLADGTEEIYFWGPDGRLATYQFNINGDGISLNLTQKSANLYFAGRLISNGSGFVGLDRLGSVASGFKYYPYGEEKQTSAQGTEKFATYYRDATGLDYADQRYYSSILGRFLTPKPDRGANSPGETANPRNWNLYTYALADPTGYYDSSGQMPVDVFSTADYAGPAPQEPFLQAANASWSTVVASATSLPSTPVQTAVPSTDGGLIFAASVSESNDSSQFHISTVGMTAASTTLVAPLIGANLSAVAAMVSFATETTVSSAAVLSAVGSEAVASVTVQPSDQASVPFTGGARLPSVHPEQNSALMRLMCSPDASKMVLKQMLISGLGGAIAGSVGGPLGVVGGGILGAGVGALGGGLIAAGCVYGGYSN